jgi:hypothetical protein
MEANQQKKHHAVRQNAGGALRRRGGSKHPWYSRPVMRVFFGKDCDRYAATVRQWDVPGAPSGAMGSYRCWRSLFLAFTVACAYCCVLLALSALSQVGAYVLLEKRGWWKAVYHQYTPETMEGGRSMCGPVKAVGAGG